MSVNKKYLNYKYKLDGKLVPRKVVFDKILSLLENGPLTIEEIEKKSKLDKSSLPNIMHKLKDYDFIRPIGKDDNRKTLYQKVNHECLLATILGPQKDIVDNFKIKGSIRRTSEQGSSKSSSTKGVTYGGSYYDSVYWDVE